MIIIGIITKILIRIISKNEGLFTRLTVLLLIYSTILSYQTYEINNIDYSILGGLFHTNNLINGIEMYIYILSIVLIIFYVKPSGPRVDIAEYRIILLEAILGMVILIESYDLISTFLAIELQSFSMIVIASLGKKESSAGLKYFLLSSLSSAIFLLGLVIIYSLTGITQYDGFNIIYPTGTLQEINYINYGLIFITIGLLFKIGAAPFHSWTPDVYDNVPTIITSWLATMGKISILAFILILKSSVNIFSEIHTFTLLTISIILCLLIGTILGLVQQKIKRLLAYSSISHLGYMLISESIDSGLAISSFLFYMFQYWLGLICIFAILIISSTQSISSLKYLRSHPAIAFAFGISLFSLTGIPPLIGFFGKQMILYTSLVNGYFLIATTAICTSVISAAYYLRIIKTIAPVGPDIAIGLNLHISRPLSWVISIITLINILFFMNTGTVLDLIHSFAINLTLQ